MTKTETNLSTPDFQTAIRHWVEQVVLPEQPNTVVLLNSQGDSEKLAQWSVLGVGCRQQITLTGNQCRRQQPNGEIEERHITPQDPSQLWETCQYALSECQQFDNEALQALGGFTGGLVGLLTYDAAPFCQPLLQTPGQLTEKQPILHWIECQRWAVWHHPTQQLFLLGDWPNGADTTWQTLCSMGFETPIPHAALPEKLIKLPSHWQSSLTQTEFIAAVESLKTAIHQGECYQANLSMRLQTVTKKNPWQLFQAVSQTNPSPFAGFWQTPYHTIVSNSPERLVNIVGHHYEQQVVSARPIAGTRGRGKSTTEDNQLASELANHPKENAEHLMLVDLLRNDLGRVSVPGTVEVDELMVLERYSHVTHLVSNVVGQLAPNNMWTDVLQAVFPGGTITGCPKIRCCEWLAEVEPVPRGFYTGSLAWVDARTNQMDSNILIRSVELTKLNANLWTAHCHVGAGIVADSAPESEYLECLKKALAWVTVLQH